MKKLLLFTAVFHLAFASLAQEVRRFNSNFHKQVSDTSSRNLRLYYLQATPATIKDYRGDTLQMIASVYGVQSVEETDAILRYYKNKSFIHGLNPLFYKKTVQLMNFNQEGQAESKWTGKNHKVYYEQVWNAEGKELLKNGSGMNSYFHEKSREKITEFYLDSLLVERYGIRKEQGDTIYYHYDKPAQPQRGMKSFYQSLVNHLEYPEKALLAQKDGTVYIQIIIDKDGELTEFMPLTDHGNKMEGSVLRVLKRLRPWKPAIFEGKPVKSKVILPVSFRR